MTYSFRWPFAFPNGPRLPFHTNEWVVPISHDWRIRIVAVNPSESLYETERPVLVGDGFESATSATTEATRARSALERAFAAFGIGAYFDSRAGGSLNLSQALVDRVREETGQVLRPDNAGLSVYPTAPAVVLLGFEARGRVSVPPEFLDAALASPAAWVSKSDEEHVAYSIYTAAMAARSQEAQFLMLVMAVEFLADVNPRPVAVRAHVDVLIQMTNDADLTSDDRGPLVNALNNLRNESVGSACRRYLHEKLDERTYRDMSPDAFFRKCYSIRSRLTHGGQRIEPSELDAWLNPLRRLVGDLLAGTELVTWRDREESVRYGH